MRRHGKTFPPFRHRHGAGNLAIMIIDNFGTPPAAPTRLRDALSA
jgi:hypothetical protein